jgi:beta-galactosidase
MLASHAVTSASPSRRTILRRGLGAGLGAGLAGAGFGGAALGLQLLGAPSALAAAQEQRQRSYEFNQGWLFGGVYTPGSAEPGFDDSGFTKVTLPHTVTPLSWANWDPATWENVFIYRKHLDGAIGSTGGGTARGDGGQRVFVDFDAVMTNALVLVNGHQVASHQGGYLPFSAELTGLLSPGDNVLAVIADARWLPVPPDGAAAGAQSVDYLQPGGIYRDVRLRAEPEVFLSDVFAKPVNVLTAGRSVGVQATIDAAAVPPGPVTVTAELLDGSRRLASASTTARITAAGVTTADLSLAGLADVTLWSRRPCRCPAAGPVRPAPLRSAGPRSGSASARRCSSSTVST